jgi:hypothetical protein
MGMEKEENPYNNLATCYSDTPLPQFLDEPATYNLMRTNKALLQCIRKKSNINIYDTQLSIEIPHSLLYKSNGIHKNSDVETFLIDKESIITSLLGNYAIAIANLSPTEPWAEYIHHLIEYTYNQNQKKLIVNQIITQIPQNKYCRNTKKNALLVESREKGDRHYDLVLNTGTIIPLPELEDRGYTTSTVSYDQTHQAFCIQKRQIPDLLTIHPDDALWKTYITPFTIIHNRYYTTISGEKMGLANFDFTPLFQEYLITHASDTCIASIIKQESPFTVQISEHLLEHPLNYIGSPYNQIAIFAIKDFFNSPMHRCRKKGYALKCGFDSLQLANIILALYKSGDRRIYPRLCNELVDITFCPITPNATIEINALGNKRTKKSGIFAFFEKDSYIYDKNNRSFPDEAYEAIIPLESIKNLTFGTDKIDNLPYNTPKTLIYHLHTIAKKKHSA